MCSFHGKNCKSGGGRHAASYHSAEKQAPAGLFSDDDYVAYIDLMGEWCGKYDVEVWAYCLMPNHMIAVPQETENLRLATGNTFVDQLEVRLGRILKPQKLGRKPRQRKN